MVKRSTASIQVLFLIAHLKKRIFSTSNLDKTIDFDFSPRTEPEGSWCALLTALSPWFSLWRPRTVPPLLLLGLLYQCLPAYFKHKWINIKTIIVYLEFKWYIQQRGQTGTVWKASWRKWRRDVNITCSFIARWHDVITSHYVNSIKPGFFPLKFDLKKRQIN